MHTISDEQLSAYLDGELPAADSQRIEAELATSASLQQRLQRLQQADRAARQFFSQQDDQPLPAALEQMILSHQPHHADNVVSLPLWRRVTPAWGIAASLLLAAGLYWHNQNTMPGVDAAFRQPVATLGSGSVQIIDRNTRLEMRWSQRNAAGEFCRHYLVHTPQASEPQEACWQDGDWQLQSPGTLGDQYQPASAEQDVPAAALNAEDEMAQLQQLRR